MRIPVGKILGTMVNFNGFMLGGYVAKAISQTEEKPSLWNRISQIHALVLVDLPFALIGTYLQFHDDLNIDIKMPFEKKIPKENKDILKERDFIEDTRKILLNYEEEKITAKEAYRKINKKFWNIGETTLLATACFFKLISDDPEVGDFIREDKVLYRTLLKCKFPDNKEVMQKREKMYLNYYEIMNKYTEEITNGKFKFINEDQWFKATGKLGMSTKIEPKEAYDLIKELLQTVLENPNATDSLDFEDITDLIQMYKKKDNKEEKEIDREIEVVAVLKNLNTNEDFRNLNENYLKSLEKEELVMLLIQCCECYKNGLVKRETLTKLSLDICKSNYGAYKYLEKNYPDTMEEINFAIGMSIIDGEITYDE